MLWYSLELPGQSTNNFVYIYNIYIGLDKGGYLANIFLISA